jgi:hypothetical protein
MIAESISLCRELILDQEVPYRVSDSTMYEWFRRACFDAKKILGTPSMDMIQYNFEPYNIENPTEINPAKFENYSNITINQYLYLTDPSKEGSIETKSIDESNRLAMIKINANCKSGTISNDVTFDISLDKPNEKTNGNIGTWLVADGLISAIQNNVYSLVDTLVSKKFAIKITIAANKTIKLVDLTIERFRLSSEFVDGDIDDIAKLMASYDYEIRAAKAIKDNNSTATIDHLYYMSRKLKNDVLNVIDGENVKSGAGGSISHHPGNKYAAAALNGNNDIADGLADGSIIYVTTDGTVRRTN